MAITKEQIQAFIRKNPVSVTCAGCFVVLAGFYFFRSDAIPQAEEQLIAANQLSDRLSLNLKNSAQLPEQLKSMRDSVQQVNGRLIQVSALATNMQYFYKLVADTGTKLIDLRQGAAQAKTDGSIAPVAFTVTVQSDYAHVMLFVRSLEKGGHFCRINSITINPASGNLPATEDAPEEPVNASINLELLGVQS